MTKRKDPTPGFLEEAERIERQEIQITDEQAEGRWVFVRPRPPKEPSQVYSVRLPATVVEELRVLASAKGEAPTALIREWVLDRMEEELARLPGWKKGSSARGARSTRRRKSGAAGSSSRKRPAAPGRAKGAARRPKKGRA